METFGSRLHRATRERGPLCVGIDPHAALLARWGLSDDVAGLERFARTVVEALADRVAVLKPQSAFFERFGSRGIGVLESIIRQSREAGAVDVAAAVAGQGDADSVVGNPHVLDESKVRVVEGKGPAGDNSIGAARRSLAVARPAAWTGFATPNAAQLCPPVPRKVIR